MPVFPFVGPPGVKTARRVSFRTVFKGQGVYAALPGGGYIDGDQSGDAGNGSDTRVLRAGTIMGKITATGLYAPSFVGALASAYTSGGTTLTVSAAEAVELDRLVGQSGTAELVAVGAPTATGTVAVTDITHSAINTTTGAITVSDLGVDKTAGTLIAVKDGRQTPVWFIGDNYPSGIKVVDIDGVNVALVQVSEIPVAGIVYFSQLLPAVGTTNTTLRTHIAQALSTLIGGKFIFDYGYMA